MQTKFCYFNILLKLTTQGGSQEGFCVLVQFLTTIYYFNPRDILIGCWGHLQVAKTRMIHSVHTWMGKFGAAIPKSTFLYFWGQPEEHDSFPRMLQRDMTRVEQKALENESAFVVSMLPPVEGSTRLR